MKDYKKKIEDLQANKIYFDNSLNNLNIQVGDLVSGPKIPEGTIISKVVGTGNTYTVYLSNDIQSTQVQTWSSQSPDSTHFCAPNAPFNVSPDAAFFKIYCICASGVVSPKLNIFTITIACLPTSS